MAPVSRVRGYVWRHGRQNQNPQSPRRALVCLIIPVHGAGLARARVRMASWEAEPPISAPRARLPDYSRTMVPVARAYARVSELETISRLQRGDHACGGGISSCL